MHWTDKLLAFFGLSKISHTKFWMNRCLKCEHDLEEEKSTIVTIVMPK